MNSYGHFVFQEHLDRNASLTRSRIAFPLRLCVVRLLQLEALSEEGLFRIAGHGLKVKRLVALIDRYDHQFLGFE